MLFVVAWGLIEYLRGILFTGFPWNLTVHIFANSPVLCYFSSLIGSYGLSVLYILLFSIAGFLYIKNLKRNAYLYILFLYCGMTLCENIIKMPDTKYNNGTILRLVQPNILQKQKNNYLYANNIFQKLMSLSLRAGKPTYIIWPEAAIPWCIKEVNKFPSNKKIPIISGAVYICDKGQKKAYNSIVLWNRKGFSMIYKKSHLVPFGEYFPLRSLFERVFPSWMMRKVTPGNIDISFGEPGIDIKVLGLTPFKALICYESIFPQRINSFSKAEWMLILTNDAWFGKSSGPYQHMAIAVLRAIESGMPVIRVANTGISCAIDSYGRLIASIGLDIENYMDVQLPSCLERTFYSKYGETGFFIILIFLLTLAFTVNNKRSKL